MLLKYFLFYATPGERANSVPRSQWCVSRSGRPTFTVLRSLVRTLPWSQGALEAKQGGQEGGGHGGVVESISKRIVNIPEWRGVD